MKRYILFIFCISALSVQSQSFPLEPVSDSAVNFFDLQSQANIYFDRHPDEEEENIWRRIEWFLEPRLYPSGKMENLTWKTMQGFQKYLAVHPPNRVTHGNWSFLGPAQINEEPHVGVIGIGRVNTLFIHPTDANILYVSAPAGGIWKTTNGGSSWTAISPDLPLLSIEDVGLDPANPNILYALTGDGDPGVLQGTPFASLGSSSIGVIKSMDGGASWYPTGFTFNNPSDLYPHKILIHPTNADTQFVASNLGLYRTTDHWDTYTQIDSLAVYDIEYHPGNPQKMYCSGTNWIRRSVDGGATWLLVSDPQFAAMASAYRVELAVTPNLPSAVYALAGGGTAMFPKVTKAVFKSVTEGLNNTWTLQDSTTDILTGQAFYNMALTISDTDHRDVFAGGIFPFRSLNASGVTGSWEFLYADDIHGDIHDMKYRAGVLYVATDGGLYKSTDNGDTWIPLWQGLGITQMYRIAGTPQDAGLMYCGVQDNGALKRDGTSTFTNVLSADGMSCQINYLHADTAYCSTQNCNLFRSFDRFVTKEACLVPGGGGAWLAPIALDPVDPSIIFAARDSVYRSDSLGKPGTWIFLGQPIGPNKNINCMKQGKNNRSRMYVSQTGKFYRTDDALASPGPSTWTNMATFPDLYITDIEVDPNDANHVYICFSGYSSTAKVYVSNLGGTTGSWLNLTGSLPNVPVNCMAFHDNGQHGLYVGTDIGVFYRDDTLDDWIYFSNSLPVVVVSDLYINTASGKIVAGTYGRGLWQSSLYTECNPTLLLIGAVELGGERHYSATSWILSQRDYNPGLGTNIHYSAGNYINLTPGFEVSTSSFFEGKIGPCPPAYTQPLMGPVSSGRPFVFTNEALAKLMATE